MLSVIGITILALIALAVAGGAAVWIFSSFAPPKFVADPGESGRRISDNGLLANYYPAKGGGKRAGILLLGGSDGGLSLGFTRMAKALQECGYSVLHVSYFRAPGQGDKLEFVRLEIFDDALTWLKSQADIDADRLAVVGVSKGAEAALIVAARHPELRAVVAGMPSSVAWQGVDWNPLNMMFMPPKGSWSLGGKLIPYLPYKRVKRPPRNLVDLYAASLADLPAHPDAMIPIEKSRAAILLVCGRIDMLWPSCQMADQLRARTEMRGGPNITILTYAKAGHGVMGLPVDASDPTYGFLARWGGTPDDNNAARSDGWEKILQHLHTALNVEKETSLSASIRAG